MSRGDTGGLDPRAWLAWAVAASVPSLVGRNLWPLLLILFVVISVRISWASSIAGSGSWSVFIRIAILFSGISVLFNALTVRAGDRVIATIPGQIPLISGEVTVNALLFGVLSGMALIILVMIGSTVAGLLDWSTVVRLIPDGMTNIAVAGSIAFAFVPQTAISFREIREAQSARGHRVRGARDLLPILVPVIGGGLERSITLAESLESRGFGAMVNPDMQPRRWTGYASALGLSSGAISIYLLVSGHVVPAIVGCFVGVACLVGVAIASRGSSATRSRYRTPKWSLRDTAVVAGASIALLTTVIILSTNPAALRYEPYPRLKLPIVDPLLLLGLLPLLVPVLVAPAPEVSA